MTLTMTGPDTESDLSPAQIRILETLSSGAHNVREIEDEIDYNIQYIRDETSELADSGYVRPVGERTGVYEITPKGVRYVYGIRTPDREPIDSDDLYHRATHIASTAIILSIFDGPLRHQDVTQFLESPPHRSTVSRIMSQLEMEGWLKRESERGAYYPGPLAELVRRRDVDDSDALTSIFENVDENLGDSLH